MDQVKFFIILKGLLIYSYIAIGVLICFKSRQKMSRWTMCITHTRVIPRSFF